MTAAKALVDYQQSRRVSPEAQKRLEAKRETEAAAPGIAETVSLEEMRGAAFIKPSSRRGENAKPIQRKSALLIIFERGQITQRQYEAGKRYRDAYDRVYGRGSYRCAINPDPRGGSSSWGLSESRSADLSQLMHARGMMPDRETHQLIPEGLFGKAQLISLMDKLCGEDITPTGMASSRNDVGEIIGKCQIALDFLCDHYRI